MLLLCIILPVFAGVVLFLLRPGKPLRMAVTFSALIAQCGLVLNLIMLHSGERLGIGDGTDGFMLSFRIDGIGSLFAGLFAASGLIITVFAFKYMSHEGAENRFFGFWLITLGVLAGLSFSANVITFYVFYEFMTLATAPLVMHEMDHKAIMAGLKYLLYSVGGALCALLGVMYLYHFDHALAFVPGGFMSHLPGGTGLQQLIVFMLIFGFSCKAGMFPLHAWLPTAHPVAPAPASALLSACITKCGVLGVIRSVFFVAGPELIRGSWVQTAWMSLTLTTVFLGSMMAYLEPVMKKRLAYSTVSQVSYVLFGLSLLNTEGFEGAILQIIFHMAVKIGLFLCAGAIIFQTGKTRMDEMRGLGRDMPVTVICWALLALSLVGIPPFGGFVSKWQLAEGALYADAGVFRIMGPAVLLVSALLTAGYLFMLPVRGFFPGEDFSGGGDIKEAGLPMAAPILLLALFALVFGVVTGPVSGIARSLASGLV